MYVMLCDTRVFMIEISHPRRRSFGQNFHNHHSEMGSYSFRSLCQNVFLTLYLFYVDLVNSLFLSCIFTVCLKRNRTFSIKIQILYILQDSKFLFEICALTVNRLLGALNQTMSVHQFWGPFPYQGGLYNPQ